jgi:hypothetical protein
MSTGSASVFNCLEPSEEIFQSAVSAIEPSTWSQRLFSNGSEVVKPISKSGCPDCSKKHTGSLAAPSVVAPLKIGDQVTSLDKGLSPGVHTEQSSVLPKPGAASEQAALLVSSDSGRSLFDPPKLRELMLQVRGEDCW